MLETKPFQYLNCITLILWYNNYIVFWEHKAVILFDVLFLQ